MTQGEQAAVCTLDLTSPERAMRILIHGLVPYTGIFPIELTLDHTIGAESGADTHDLIVVGAGPDGLATAVYGGIRRPVDGGHRITRGGARRACHRASTTTWASRPVYLVRSWRLELLSNAQKFAAAILAGREACLLLSADGIHTLQLGDGRALSARVVVLATGAGI